MCQWDQLGEHIDVEYRVEVCGLLETLNPTVRHRFILTVNLKWKLRLECTRENSVLPGYSTE